MKQFLLTATALASWLPQILAVKIYQSPKELKTREYDFVIVGGGTAVGNTRFHAFTLSHFHECNLTVLSGFRHCF